MNPHDTSLYNAAAVYGRQVRGTPPRKLTLTWEDGSEVVLAAPTSWPRPDGWDFRPGEAAYDGVRFRLGGKTLGILRLLAERPGDPVSADRLKREVWGEEPDMVEDANLHGHVSQLRRRLREALGLAAEDNPVTFFCGAYRLAIH